MFSSRFPRPVYLAITSGIFTRCSERKQTRNSLVRSTWLTSRSLVPSSPQFCGVAGGSAHLIDWLLLAIGLAGALFKSSRVIVDASGIQARQNWLVFSTTKQFAASEISSSKLRNGMSSGQTVYYDLQAVTNGKATSTLASSIWDKKEAQWLAAEMQRLLKLDNAPASPSIQA